MTALIAPKKRIIAPKPLEGSLSTFTLAEVQSFRNGREKGKKSARDAQGIKVLFAYLAKTLTGINPSGMIEEIALRDGEIHVPVPLFAGMLRSIQKEVTKSNPLYAYRADFADVDEQEVARFGSTLIEYFTQLFFTPEYEQSDALAAIAFGFSGAEEWWDETAGEETTLVHVSCECGAWGYLQERNAQAGEITCSTPDCERIMTKGEAIKKPAGDVRLRRLDPFSINSNTWATPDRPAVWWSIDEIVDKAVFAELHPELADHKPGTSVTLGLDLLHLRRARAWERAQMGLESDIHQSRSYKESLDDREVIRMRDFLAPAVYRNRVTSEAEELPSGRKIPAKQKLEELFPDGMCVLRDGAAVVDIYPAAPRRQIKLYNYAVKFGDRWGASVAAQALECQYSIEELLSQAVTCAYELGNPVRVYDESIIDGETGTHPTGGWNPIRRRLNDTPVRDLIYDFAPAGVSPQVIQLALIFEQRMQGILGAYSPIGGGLPDAVGNTATGVMRASAEQQSQQGMYLELRSHAKLGMLEEAIRLFAENADITRALAMAGPFGDGAPLMINRHQIPSKFTLEVRKDSWWPRDRGQQQAAESNRLNILMLANQASMLLHGEPLSAVEERYYSDLFGSEIGANLAQIAAEIAVEQWRKVKDFLTRAAQGGDLRPEERDALEQANQQLKAVAEDAAQQQAALSLAENLGSAEAALAPAPTAEAPPPEEVLLAAADLLVPILPGIHPLRAIAGQLRYEGLKFKNRNLPPLLLQWLSRRAEQNEEMAQQKMAKLGAAAAPVQPPPGAPEGAPGNPAGQAVGQALLTKLAALTGGTQDASGLPSLPDTPALPMAATPME